MARSATSTTATVVGEGTSNPARAAGRHGGRAGRRLVTARDIGIIGHGRIGRRVGELAAAFGMRVLAYDPFAPPPAEVACDDLDELIATSDGLTLHVPLTPQTQHLVDAALLGRTKPGAVLANCGRGGLLDLDAAHAALQSGQLAGIDLDVFEPEPPPYHPIFDHPNVSLSPHLMGLTRNATATTFADAARGVLDVLDGRRPAALANPGWTEKKDTAWASAPGVAE